MDGPVLVRVAEGAGDFARQPQRLVERHLLLTIDACPQRLAGDERHHVIELPARRARVEQREDVGVTQTRRDRDFLQEAFGANGPADIRIDDFHRDAAVVLEIFGQVHRGHAAAAQLAFDAIARNLGAASSSRISRRIHGLPSGETAILSAAQRCKCSLHRAVNHDVSPGSISAKALGPAC